MTTPTVQPLTFPPGNQPGGRFRKPGVLRQVDIPVVPQDLHGFRLPLILQVAEGSHHDNKHMVGTRGSVHGDQTITLNHSYDYLVIVEDTQVHSISFKDTSDGLNNKHTHYIIEEVVSDIRLTNVMPSSQSFFHFALTKKI